MMESIRKVRRTKFSPETILEIAASSSSSSSSTAVSASAGGEGEEGGAPALGGRPCVVCWEMCSQPKMCATCVDSFVCTSCVDSMTRPFCPLCRADFTEVIRGKLYACTAEITDVFIKQQRRMRTFTFFLPCMDMRQSAVSATAFGARDMCCRWLMTILGIVDSGPPTGTLSGSKLMNESGMYVSISADKTTPKVGDAYVMYHERESKYRATYTMRSNLGGTARIVLAYMF